MIQELLADLYHVHPLRVDFPDVGHSGVSRERVYVVIASKQLRVLADPVAIFATISSALRERYTTRPSDYMTAEKDEINFEAFECARAMTPIAG